MPFCTRGNAVTELGDLRFSGVWPETTVSGLA